VIREEFGKSNLGYSSCGHVANNLAISFIPRTDTTVEKESTASTVLGALHNGHSVFVYCDDMLLGLRLQSR
jgi:hypothetical protein